MRRLLSECQNEYETTLVERINNGHWQITSVFGDEDSPPFTYSIGIYENFGQPEVIIFGIDGKSAGAYINRYGANVRDHQKVYLAGNFYSGIMDNLDVYMTMASASAKDEHALSCNWFYKGADYPLMQCIWPSNKGFWPWDINAWEDYKKMQPVYGDTPRLN